MLTPFVHRAVALAVLTGAAGLAQAVTVVVPGTANPYLAGMPAGSTAPPGDSAPAHSPVLVEGLTFAAGMEIVFRNVGGGVSRGPGCVGACNPLDGNEFFNHSGDAQNGISGARIPIESLVGVFLGPDRPDLGTAPAALNFQTLGLNFASLSPLVQQVFFIGNGQTAGGDEQTFVVPTGATRLYLAVWDGFGWFNNSGAITVDVQAPTTPVPEPGTWALLAAGLGAIGLRARRRLTA